MKKLLFMKKLKYALIIRIKYAIIGLFMQLMLIIY